MTRQIKINLESVEFDELEKIKESFGLSWERLIIESIRKFKGIKI